jgi:hypothetical protein
MIKAATIVAPAVIIATMMAVTAETIAAPSIPTADLSPLAFTLDDDIIAVWDANQHQSPMIRSNRSGSSKPPSKSARIATRKL